MLAHWRRTAAPSSAAGDTTPAADESDSPEATLPTARVSASPALAGLLKLRERVPRVADHVATDDPDADAVWARDLLAATGARTR